MGVAAPFGLSFALLVDALSWCLIVALLIIWRHTYGRAFLYLANVLNFHVHIPHVWDHTFNLGKPFEEINAGITEWLLDNKRGLEIEIAWTWHALGEIWHKTARMLEWAVDETVGAFERLEHVKVPQWAKWAAAAALPSALLAKIVASVVALVRPLIRREAHAAAHAVPPTINNYITRAAPVALPGALGIPKIWREINGLTKRNLRLSKRLHRVEGLFGVAVMAAAMANVFGIPNWRCLTRGNVGKTARRLCGMPTHWLNDVLGLLADFFVLENICTVLPWLEAAVSEVATPLVVGLTEAGAGMCHTKDGPAKAMPVPPLYLPAYAQSLTAGV